MFTAMYCLHCHLEEVLHHTAQGYPVNKDNTCISTSTLTFNYNAEKFYFPLVEKRYASYSIASNSSDTHSTGILQHDL
jgi:hypothetical protein